MRFYTESYNRVAAVAWNQSRINQTEIHHLTYKEEKVKTTLGSQLTISARMKACESVKACKTKLRKGEKTSAPHSELCSVRYDARSFRFIKGSDHIVSLGTCEKPVKLTYSVPAYAQDYFNNWKHGSADLVYKKGKFWLHLTVSKEFEFTPNELVIGADMGINRPCVTSDNRFHGKRRWKGIDRKYKRVNKSLQVKGTKSAKRKLKQRSGRRNRFRNDCDHVLSKQLVNSVPKGTTIVIEDLTNVRKSSERKRNRKMTKDTRGRIHNWSFARLRGYIEYKAKMAGVMVVAVDPAFSSQECSACGCVHKESRDRSKYKCIVCDFELNSDLNAARVLKNRYKGSLGKPEIVGVQSITLDAGVSNLQAPSFRAG